MIANKKENSQRIQKSLCISTEENLVIKMQLKFEVNWMKFIIRVMLQANLKMRF